MDRRIILLVAVILVVGGLYGYLNEEKAPAPVEDAQVIEVPEPEEDMVPVWAARKPIAKGALVRKSDLKKDEIPESRADELGLEDDALFALQPDSRALANITAGTVVLQENLVTPDNPSYIDLVITRGMIPYPVELPSGGHAKVLRAGDQVDIVMISSLKQNLSQYSTVENFQGLSVSPLLNKKTVLKIDEPVMAESVRKTTVILELSQTDVSRLMLAQRIGILDVYRSNSRTFPQVRTGDVLPDYSAVVEMRGSDKVVN